MFETAVVSVIVLTAGYFTYRYKSQIETRFEALESSFESKADTVKDEVTGEIRTVDADAIKALHAAENDGKVAEGTVQKYVDAHLPTVEADAKAVVADVKADVQAVEAKL